MTRPPWRKKHDEAYRHPRPNPATHILQNDVCAAGKRKLAYTTKRIALEAAAKLQARNGTKLRPYLCKSCFDWHLTSQPQNGPRP